MKNQILSKVTDDTNFQMFSTFTNFRDLKLSSQAYEQRDNESQESPSEICLWGMVEETRVNGVNGESIHKSRINLFQNQLDKKSKWGRVWMERYNSFYGQSVFIMASFILQEICSHKLKFYKKLFHLPSWTYWQKYLII